ncbi:MAG: helix-turn-helix domain-containing protein, partial [Holosporaceae bacterium]
MTPKTKFSKTNKHDPVKMVPTRPASLQTSAGIDDLVRPKIKAYLATYKKSHMLPHDLHKHVLQEMETALIEEVLKFVGYNQSQAAKILGLHRNTLRCKLRTLR